MNDQLAIRSMAGGPTSDRQFLIHEPADVYHDRSGEFLTSHLLADFRKCPLLYHRKRCGLVPDEDRPAYLVGRAAHTVILEGLDAFRSSYAVGGPVNPTTGRPYGVGTKAWTEWAESHGKQVLSGEQYNLVMHMATSVKTHAYAQELLASGHAEAVVRTDYCGLACQIRMDWFDAHQGIVDLKSCDDLTYFEVDARRFGYVFQLAFYRAVLAQRIGVLMPVFLLAVEKKEPFRAGVWRVDPQALAIAQGENEQAIGRLKRCWDRNAWPTGYEEPRVFGAM